MSPKKPSYKIGALLFFLILLSLSGCSILFGNIKPSIEKSDRYSILDLSKNSDGWVRLEPQKIEESQKREPGENEVSDFAYQSKETASIISINSACTPENEPEYDLGRYTQLLLLGISEKRNKDQKNVVIDEKVALETTVEGKVDGGDMKLRTIVVKQKECIYDMMYVGKLKNFDNEIQHFERFSSSLQFN